MQWIQLISSRMNTSYAVSDKMMGMLNDDELNWKPDSGQNWMTVGQLMKHMTNSCGFCCRGFATGDWGMPESDGETEHMDMLPPAEALPTVGSVAEARKLLQEDRLIGLAVVEEAGEHRLETENSAAPWDPNSSKSLGLHCLEMVHHLDSHKSQLFYYLKLMGKKVDTMTLWGM